jgi:hypothetical protein
MNLEVAMRRAQIGSAILVAALVGVLLPVHAKSSPITFERAYGGIDDEIGSAVQQTFDGGYIMTGPVISWGPPITSVAWLVRTDERGDTLWTRVFGGPRGGAGLCVEQTPDSGYVLAGGSPSLDTLGDVWLTKIDPRGDTVWTRVYGGAMEDGGDEVTRTTDGGYIVVGRTASFGSGGTDVWLIKTDSSGDTVWTRTFGGPSDDWGESVRQTNDSGYIIASITWSFGSGKADVYLIKTSVTGDTQWTRTFGGVEDDYGLCARQTSDGGYVVGGWTMSTTDSTTRIYLIKTDSHGDALWTKTVNSSSGFAEGGPIEQLDDGGYIVTGCVAGGMLYDVYLVRTDPNGETLWTRSFGGSDLDMGSSVQPTRDGGFIVVGETYSFGAGASDLYLIKTDENGNLAVAEPKSAPSRKSVLSITCEPNPFRASTVLHLAAGPLDHSATHLRIYDAQGRLVRILAAGPASQTMWDGRNDAGQLLPSGTYLVRCDAGGERVTTRLVLQR